MVKKTIPQLGEVTTIPDNAYFVVDNGSVTKKISRINIQKTFKQAARTISIDAQNLTIDDDTVLFSPAEDTTINFILPAAGTAAGKAIRIKNIGLGTLIGSGNDIDEKIDGEDTIDITGLNKSFTLVCNGSNWFIF